MLTLAPEVSPLLTHLNDIAERMIAGAAPFRFGIARSPAELESIFRLRYQTAIQRGWARPQDFPDGLERDAYDQDAIHLAAWDDRADHELVCTARLVLPSPGRPLPTEAAFDLTIEPLGKVVDCHRIAVASAYRGQGLRVLAGMIGHVWLEARRRYRLKICGIQSAAIIKLFEKLGVHMTTLGPPRAYWGELRYPVRFDLLQSIPTLAARWGT